jgi:RNA polymerase sigma factor (sigma-70 family)
MAIPKEKKNNSALLSIYDTFLGSESALRRYLTRFVHRPEDIDDMAQETFLRAYTATSGRDIDFPKAYLFRVAKSVALRQLTKKTNQVTEFIEEAHMEEPAAGQTVEQEVEAEQKIRQYCEAIAELPPQCRRVFLMRKYQGLPHKEIAAQLNISVGAVEKQVTLGIKRCVSYMERMEVQAEDPARSTGEAS